MKQIRVDEHIAVRLAEDGFVTVPLLDPDEVAQLLDEVTELDRIGSASAQDYGGASFAHPDPAFRRRAMSAVEAILSPRIARLFEGHAILLAGCLVKRPGSPGLDVHQDWTMSADPQARLFNIWCALVDIDEANGALALVPGSHCVAELISGPGIGGYWNGQEETLKERSVVLRPRAGEAVIFDNRVLHWSLENHTAATRPIATMTCMPEGTIPALYRAGELGEAQYEVIDMSSDGYLDHGADGCRAGAPERRRIGAVTKLNGALEWSEIEARTGGSPEAGPRLVVSNLSKKYCHETRRTLRYGVADILSELVPGVSRAALRPGEFLAIDDVEFSLDPGEALAVIGHNGAGKSTLLKIIYGLLKPDAGEVRLRGSVGAMIELGTGLNPVLTGRENVMLGAALAGLNDSDTRKLLDDVVGFSELDGAIDAPFQAYSSGMKARLAYALATHLKPDILLVDEVLAVGDIHFQRKCVNHMRSYLAAGGSLLFVSHNTYQVQSVCNRGLLLDHGRVAFQGSAVEALNRMFESRLQATPAPPSQRGDESVVIEELRVDPLDGDRIETGRPARVTLTYSARERADVLWGFSMWTGDSWVCVTGSHDMRPRMIEAGRGDLSCVIPRLPLVPGRYRIRASIVDRDSFHPLALYGAESGGSVVDVRGAADLLVNVQIQMDQLVTIDVDWG